MPTPTSTRKEFGQFLPRSEDRGFPALLPMTEDSKTHLSFPEVCEYLTLDPAGVTQLRDAGLIICSQSAGKQSYPRESLEISRRIFAISRDRNWEIETTAWFADLIFCNCYGRALIWAQGSQPSISTSWLEIPNLKVILKDFENSISGKDEQFNNLLRSIVTLGDGRFWDDLESLAHSPLFPIISYFESINIPIIGQGETVTRDASALILSLVLAFTQIAPPISQELRQLINAVKTGIGSAASTASAVSPADIALIQRETGIAVDRWYALKASEIHTPPDNSQWQVDDDVIKVRRRTIQLVVDMPLPPGNTVLDNILDIIQPFITEFGRRVLLLLYEIANDGPYWRNPTIEVNANELLDRLGLKRDANGYHYSKNRERLRDALYAAHFLTIVGEYPDWVDGKAVRRVISRSVISIVGATYDPEEGAGMSTLELFEHGLPKTMTIKLQFYDSVRSPDGKLGNNYVPVPRLKPPEKLGKANYSATSEALRSYFILRFRQTNNRTLIIKRKVALEKANITNKNVGKATLTLRKALDRLVKDNSLERYTYVPPSDPEATFEVILSEAFLKEL